MAVGYAPASKALARAAAATPSTPPPAVSPSSAAAQRAFDFAYTARNNNLGGSFSDPVTGANYYTGGSASGSGSRSGAAGTAGGGGADTFDLDLSRARSALPPSSVGPASAAPHVELPSEADPTAAQRAVFARAKDRVGQIGGGALASLRSAAAARGQLGGAMEARGTASVVNQAQGELGDVVRDQAIQQYGRTNQVSDRNVAANLQQRSADMDFSTAARGQDLAAENARVSQLQGLMALLRASRTGAAY